MQTVFSKGAARTKLFHTIMTGASGVVESSQMATPSVRKKRKGLAMPNAIAGPSTSPADGERKGVPGLRGRRRLGLLASLPSLPLDILLR